MNFNNSLSQYTETGTLNSGAIFKKDLDLTIISNRIVILRYSSCFYVFVGSCGYDVMLLV